MKLKATNDGHKIDSRVNGFTRSCLSQCQKILRQLTKVKETLFEESRGPLRSQERLIRLALTEAEALSWQTLFPHLVFPTLAQEKIRTLRTWSAHQQLVWHGRRKP